MHLFQTQQRRQASLRLVNNGPSVKLPSPMTERHHNPACSPAFGRYFLARQRRLKSLPETTKAVAEAESRIAIDHADAQAIGGVARIRTATRLDSVIVVIEMIDAAAEIVSKMTIRSRTPPQQPVDRAPVALTRTVKINQSDQDVVEVDAVVNVVMTQPPTRQ
jgi:hypothetical protein